MFKVFSVFLIFISQLTVESANDTALRSKIGPTVSSPVENNGKLYFLATTGVLYEINKNLEKLENIFQTEKNSLSGITINNNIAYFGEGLNKDDKVNLYAFDLTEKKLKSKTAIEGHIGKRPALNNGILYIALGPKGLGSYDISSQKFLWKIDKFGRNTIHTDSTPIFYGKNVCIGSRDKFKGIVCLNKKTGSMDSSYPLKYSAKSELALSRERLFGFATEANLVDSKWNTPSTFFIIDLQKNKLIKEVELRGFNFYSPTLINQDEVFIAISTGDIITISLNDGKISYVSEFPEPFLSNTFVYKKQYCAIGAMGMLLCYKKTQKNWALSYEKRYYESPIGKISGPIDGKHYLPSRTGFFNL